MVCLESILPDVYVEQLKSEIRSYSVPMYSIQYTSPHKIFNKNWKAYWDLGSY
jgi:hypothetical protein